ncbi:MAG: hypothetical protein KF799_04030 [Bdellovibrionales bacterium]|nr:hypothetical protein [Bdellovibrionales bacterium]
MQTLIVLMLVVSSLALTACKSGGKSSGSGSTETPQERNNLIPAQFGPNFKYNELMIKDYDEMMTMVQDLVKKSQTATSKDDTGGEGEAVEWLGRATKLIFSRPDSDNMVAKLLNEVRRELQGFNSYEDTFAGIADEAIRNASDKNTPVSVQSTALVILENILREIRPSVINSNNQAFLRIVERVADANLKITDEVRKDRRLRGMFLTKNPSDEAKAILKTYQAQNKKKK